MKLKKARRLLCILFAVLIIGAIFFYRMRSEVYPFFAVTQPVNGEVLVVEGWIPDYALEEAAAVFRQGRYTALVTTGLKSTDNPLPAYSSEAQRAEKIFADLGLEASRLIAVPAARTTGSKTFSCARALQEWLRSTRPGIQSVDVFTLGGHARKTHLLFKKALGENISVGIIAARPRIYDPACWWASKAGIALMARSLAGYVYAVIFSVCLV
jgi:uncharacterized SAM-binding protein YcdF (DUF218 family)